MITIVVNTDHLLFCAYLYLHYDVRVNVIRKAVVLYVLLQHETTHFLSCLLTNYFRPLQNYQKKFACPVTIATRHGKINSILLQGIQNNKKLAVEIFLGSQQGKEPYHTLYCIAVSSRSLKGPKT